MSGSLPPPPMIGKQTVGVSKAMFVVGLIAAIAISSIISVLATTQLTKGPKGDTGSIGPQGLQGPPGKGVIVGTAFAAPSDTQTITSTSYVDMPGMTAHINLSNAANYYSLFIILSADATGWISVRALVDSTATFSETYLVRDNSMSVRTCSFWAFNVPSGEYTVKIIWKAGSNGGWVMSRNLLVEAFPQSN
jgi:hypothetical protein